MGRVQGRRWPRDSRSSKHARMIHRAPSQRVTVAALGIVQILAWGSTFYLPAILAARMEAETGWPLSWIVGGASIGLLVAGLLSPTAGRLIDERGGRPVLAASSLIFAAGLVGIGASSSLPVYLAAWAVTGVAMGLGLYDAVFAALGRRFGDAARMPITTLTLFGGFASTVCWPLSAFLVEEFGWRETCFIYAALQLLLALPLNLYATRGERPGAIKHTDAPANAAANSKLRDSRELMLFILLAVVLSIAAGAGSIINLHLVTLMQARGLELAGAIFMGTLIGPSQVAARIVESLFGNRYHPIWTMNAAIVLMAIGLGLLWLDLPIIAAAVVLYAAGYGVSWIARGTLPLALFGAVRFPRLIGKLAFPSLVVQAAAPWVAALQIERFGANATIATIAAFALANVLFMAMLWGVYRRR